MTWNYRIMRCEVDITPVGGAKLTDVSYGIHEVYYNQAGQVVAWSEEPPGACCETVDDLRDMLNLMQGAFEKPVLDYDMEPEGEFDSEGEPNDD